MDYIIAGLASLGLFIYLVVRLAATGEVLRGHAMTSLGILQILVFFALIFLRASRWAPTWPASSKDSARSCTRFCGGWRCWLTRSPAFTKDVEQRWTQYTASLLSFSIFGFLLMYIAAAGTGIFTF